MNVILIAGVSALVFGCQVVAVAVIAGARLQDLIIEMRDLQQLRTLHIQGLHRAGIQHLLLGGFFWTFWDVLGHQIGLRMSKNV